MGEPSPRALAFARRWCRDSARRVQMAQSIDKLIGETKSMSIESQRSIVDWADHTFGKVLDPLTSGSRAASEMKEFIGKLNEALSDRETSQAALPYIHFGELCSEAADIVICLYRMVDGMGADLGSEIDRKMAINRQRQWRSHGDGTGQHIREGAQE